MDRGLRLAVKNNWKNLPNLKLRIYEYFRLVYDFGVTWNKQIQKCYTSICTPYVVNKAHGSSYWATLKFARITVWYIS